MLSDGIRANKRLDKAYEMLTQVPFFAGVRREAVEIEALGSLTNMSYKVSVGGAAYVLRLPGQDTWEYIDRAAEEHNSRVAAAAGLGADVLYCDTRGGTMVTRFIEGEALDGAWLSRDAEALVRVARTLKRLHGSGANFRSRFDIFGMIGRYRNLLHKSGQPLPAGYGALEDKVEAARRALEAAPVPLAPCHNDSWPSNFIDDGDRIYLIDWEFSGMNDPFWDLGHLSAEARFGPGQDRTMVEAYCGGVASEGTYARLEIYKALDDLLWSLWGFIQHANENPADDFLAYARERFGRFTERVNDPGFGRHLNAVRPASRFGSARNAPARWRRAAKRAPLLD